MGRLNGAGLSDVATLLDRCRVGNELAWEMLVRRYQSRVYAVAFHYTRNAEEARDLAQEIFVRVYQRLESFHGEQRFLPLFFFHPEIPHQFHQWQDDGDHNCIDFGCCGCPQCNPK